MTKQIFQQITELEEYLGPYVDFKDFKDDVRKLRACTMDPAIQQKYIEKLSFDDETNTGMDVKLFSKE